jgi:peptide/nickel transport system substrate-binding protein
MRLSSRPALRLSYFARPFGSLVAVALLGVSACQPAAPAAPLTAPPAATAVPQAQAKPTAAAAAPTAAPAAAGQPTAAAQPAGETPRRGGELTFVVSAEPPSFDGHRETTFAMIHPTAPHYSLLIKFDPFDSTKVVPDLAESWTISPDKLTYTFKIRSGVKFHDGSALTSKDIKATYDKIIFPKEGVVSARQASYSAVASVEAPDDATVVFKLKRPSASMLQNLASPWNYIYSAKKLEEDPHWYEKNVMGTGPFVFTEYVRGDHWSGKRFEDYWDKGKPYLDSFRAIFITDTAAQIAAVRGGRAMAEFRGFPPTARDDLVRAMGNEITVQESQWICALWVALNTEKKPFDDPRVRRALSLAVDRWEGSKALSQVAFVKEVGSIMRPGSQYAAPQPELVKLLGFALDGNDSKNQAKALLREAGVPDGFGFVLKNRNVPMPYDPVAVFLIDQWKKIGLNPTQQVLESAAWTNDLRGGNYETMIDFNCDFMDDPDLQLAKFISTNRSPINYGRYSDPKLDDLYDRQSQESDPAKRAELVREFERVALNEQAWQVPTIWWQRIIPHNSKMKGWKISPSHYLNQDLATVWLAP